MKRILKRISALGFTLLFALTAIVFAACDTKPEEPATLTYSVTVVKDDENTPVSGVQVKFGNFPATTGTDGKASIELEKGEYTITLSRLPEGYTYSAEIKLTAELHEVVAKLVYGTGDPEPVQPADPNADRTYSVTVLYPNGDPVTGITVQLCINTLCLKPVSVNAKGTATQTQKPNNYHVKLNNVPSEYTYPQDGEGYYTGEELTATKTSLTITLTSVNPPEPTLVEAKGVGTYEVTVESLDSYAELGFYPTQSGLYKITSVTDVYDAKIGYYSYRYLQTPWASLEEENRNDNVSATDKNFSYTIGMYDDEVISGSGQIGAQAWWFHVHVNATNQNGARATFPAKFNVSITRIGDYVRREVQTTDAKITSELSQFAEGSGTLTAVPMDGTANLVFNETDGFYHLGSADGAIVTVKLTSAPRYYDRALIEIDKEIAGVSGSSSVYRFDVTPEADKNDESKPLLYLDYRMMLRGSLNPLAGKAEGGYAAYVNSDGVYGLTKDLEEFLKHFASSVDAKELMKTSGYNEENYWLFACYYYA